MEANEIEVSIIVEAYTFDEGGAEERFIQSIGDACEVVEAIGKAELLVLDVTEDGSVDELLKERFPQVRRVEVTGFHYDSAKVEAARQARGIYLLYLDGDCLPEPGWHEALLGVLRSDRSQACGGWTRYEGGWLQKILSVMDFGFFYPVRERTLECYASNNFGISRELQIDTPPAEGGTRCACFNHAQELKRKNRAVWFNPEA